MTKIQVRRDTAANWSSTNPVLASGEPAFETDTGVLKIGDGVTAYNSLPQINTEGGEEYVLPVANNTTLGGVKIAKKTVQTFMDAGITIDDDGLIRVDPNLNLVQLSVYQVGAENYKTLKVINVNGTYMLGTNTNLGVTDNYSCYIHADGNSGEVIAQAPSGIGSNAYGRLQIKDYNNGASNYCELFLNANKGSWNGVTDPHNRITSNVDVLEISRYIDGYQVFHNIDTGNLQENIIAGENITTSVAEDGKITINATGSGTLPDNVTTQGNTFNGASQLVQLDSTGKLPAIDGSQLTNLPAGSAPSNMVTTDTAQTINAVKTFNAAPKVTGIQTTGGQNIINYSSSMVQIAHVQALGVALNANGKQFFFNGSSATIDGKTVATVDDIPDTSSFATQASVNSINSALNGLKFWKGTQTDYNEIETKDENTLYIITG